MRTTRGISDKDHPYEIVHSLTHKIGRFEIVQDTILLNNQEYPYSYIREKDCACILPVYQGKVALIRQYRHSVDRWLLELPCGQIEKGEEPKTAAIRELAEETGLVTKELTSLGAAYMRAGVSTGTAYLYLAECCDRQTPKQEGAELIEVQFHTPAQVDALEFRGDFAQLLGIVCWHRARSRIGDTIC